MANVAGTVVTDYNTLISPATVAGLALGTNTSFVTLAAGTHTITPSSTSAYTRSVLIIAAVTTGATVSVAAGTFWGSKAVNLGTLGANQIYAVVFEGGNVGSVTAGAQTISVTVGAQTVGAIFIELP
jgi:hypothetical protein